MEPNERWAKEPRSHPGPHQLVQGVEGQRPDPEAVEPTFREGSVQPERDSGSSPDLMVTSMPTDSVSSRRSANSSTLEVGVSSHSTS